MAQFQGVYETAENPYLPANHHPAPIMSDLSRDDGKYIYKLVIEQQPERARMCGFGDKDRRPITPPPCVRLLVLDRVTQQEVPCHSIDSQHFILNVDLWDDNGTQEMNLVRHAHAAPSVNISMSTTTSYPPAGQEQAPRYSYPQHYASQNMSVHGGYYAPHPQYHPMHANPALPTGANSMYTRNLIGNLTVSAVTLVDNDGKSNLWFVLQDLSVRQEGNFRLKMAFINVGFEGKLNSGACPVLATALSQPFQVFSAKKFPGVKESTILSKCFAGQGVKIPIRKDASSLKAGNGDDDNNDDA